MIFYLSCTGNTRWAAERLASITNERTVSIPDAVMGDCAFHLHAGERVGFCLPVHGWRVQPMVKEFIGKLKLDNENAYCYFLLTCGDNCGTYAEQLEQLIGNAGLSVKSCCSLVMPESYVGLPFMDVDTDLREAEKKMNANGVLKRFAENIVDHRSVRMPIVRGSMPWALSNILGPIFYKWLITDKRYRCDEGKCTGCGRCAKACPVGNIQMVDGKPQWQHNGRCMTCMACYHYCNAKAISFWHFTKGKGQYYFAHNRK